MKEKIKKEKRRQKGSGYVFLRGKTYYLQYTINGKTRLKSLRTTKKVEAEKKAKELLDPAIHSNDKVQVIHNVAEAKKVLLPSTLNLDDVWKAYLKIPTEDKPNSSKGTLGNYERNWLQFKEWLNTQHPGIKYLSNQIDENIAKEYRDYLKSLNLADVTFNYKIGSLKLIFRILQSKANLSSNVWDSVKRIKNPKQETKQAFTFQEATNLLNVFNDGYRDKDGKEYLPMHKEQLRVLFVIGVYTGLRLIDCVHLRWSNIKKFDTGMAVQCKPQKTIQFNKVITAPVVKPLQDAFLQAKEWKDDTDYICPAIAERYDYNPSGVRKDVIKTFKFAGYRTTKGKDGASKESRQFSAYGFHSLRHALFSFLCSNGVTMERLKAWSGDSEKTLLKYYLHAETEKLISDAQELLTFNGIIDLGKKPEEALQLTGSEPERVKLIEYAKSLPLEEVIKYLNDIEENMR